MRIRTGLPNSTVNPLGDVPKVLVITDPDNIHPLPPGVPTQQTATPEQVLESIAEDLKKGFKGKETALINDSLMRANRFGVIYMGGSDYLPAIAQPAYAAMVPVAANNFITHADAIYEAVPAAAVIATEESIRADLDHLQAAQTMKQNLTSAAESVTRVESHLLVRIHGKMVGLNQVARSTLMANVALANRLQPFLTLTTVGAEEALEMRQNNERVAAEERNATVEAVKKVLTPKAPTPGTPTPPAPDLSALDALKTKRTRGRGSSEQ